MRVLALAVFASAICCQALGATYECDATPSLSRIGVPAGNAVSITADREKRECRFSVNGTSVGSPPPEEIAGAFAALQRNEFFVPNNPRGTYHLGILLLAAASDTVIPQQLDQALKRNEKDLLTCLDQLKADSVDDRKLPLSGGGQCGSSRNPTEVSVEGMRAAVGPNTVWVVVTLGKKTHALFLPTTIKRGLPVIPPR